MTQKLDTAKENTKKFSLEEFLTENLGKSNFSSFYSRLIRSDAISSSKSIIR